jgi:hypothetical protein
MREFNRLIIGVALGVIVTSYASAAWYPEVAVGTGLGVPNLAATSDVAGNLHLMFMYPVFAPNYCNHHVYTRSLDGGVTWEDARGIFSGISAEDFGPALATSGGMVFAFGCRRSDQIIDGLYLTRSWDFGESWSEPARCLFPGSSIRYPRAVAHEGQLAVLYQNRTAPSSPAVLYFSKSTDLGEAWSEPECVNAIAGSSSEQPDMVVDAYGWLHAVWVSVCGSPAGSKVMYNRSRDWGLTWDWGNTGLLVSGGVDTCLNTHVAAVGGSVYIVWEQRHVGPTEPRTVCFARQTDGVGWQVRSLFPGSSPAIAGNEDGCHIVWVMPSMQLWYASSPDFGVNWSEYFAVTENLGRSSTPPLLHSDFAGIHVFYSKWTQDVPKVHYRQCSKPTLQDGSARGVTQWLPGCTVGPNPASAAVRFSLRGKSRGRVVVRDALGKSICDLGDVNTGYWDCRSAPSGVYFYRISSSGQLATGKVLLAH